MNNPIILFDGVCNYCNRWVNFIIRHDKKKKLRFTALQSDAGKKILENNNLSHLINNFDTFVLIDKEKIFFRSSAGVRIGKYLDGGWKIFYVFILIPNFIRDFFYNIIARNRYKWWGKRNECMIPTEEIKNKFL